MRKRQAELVGIALALGIGFVFLAPVLYWENISPVTFYPWPVYRSIGCATFGQGLIYAGFMRGPNDPFGLARPYLHLGCSLPGQWDLP